MGVGVLKWVIYQHNNTNEDCDTNGNRVFDVVVP